MLAVHATLLRELDVSPCDAAAVAAAAMLQAAYRHFIDATPHAFALLMLKDAAARHDVFFAVTRLMPPAAIFFDAARAAPLI